MGTKERFIACRICDRLNAAFYPATGERFAILPEGRDKSLEMYETAITGIERGEFTPKPSRDWPNGSAEISPAFTEASTRL